MTPAMARSATVEIVVHFAVLLLVLFPILTVIFPALLLSVGATMLANTFAPGSMLSIWIEESRLAPLFVACVVALVIAGSAILWSEICQMRAGLNKLREPSGRDGQRLLDIVADLWRQLNGSTMPPVVRWFPSMDIAAYADHTAVGPELHVSAGLWRAIVSNHPTARAILAHEIAHLVYRDVRVLRWVKYIDISARSVLLMTAVTGMFTLIIVLIQQTGEILSSGQDVLAILLTWIRIIISACVVLILLPLCWLALRRQIAFITSLIEIRADIAAALWTGGLERFTQLFAESENVVRSTRRDLISAMLSPGFTHIPERERLEILSTPAYIITPKLRFFTFSLLLVFLLPINFATPLLFGGAVNYLAMLSLSVSLNVAIITMLLVGLTEESKLITLSIRRRVTLAVVTCVVGALPRINLEPVSYLAMSWLVGFGGAPMDWSQLPHDLSITVLDLARRIGSALFNPFAALAIIGAYAAVTLLSNTASWPVKSPIKLRCAAPVAVAGISTIVAGIDPRLPLPFDANETIRSTIAAIGINHTLYLCFPLASAAIIDFIYAGWIVQTD